MLGLVGIGALRLLRLVLRILSSAFVHAGTALVRIYDILVFMPLWIEHRWGRTDGVVADEHRAEVAS